MGRPHLRQRAGRGDHAIANDLTLMGTLVVGGLMVAATFAAVFAPKAST